VTVYPEAMEPTRGGVEMPEPVTMQIFSDYV
jgi:hypothetical protein